MKIFILTSFYSIVLLVFSKGLAGEETQVVESVDLQRYLGKWYEIATIPQRFQLGCTNVTTEYTLNPNGTVKVVNSCRKEGQFKQVVGRAKIVPGSNNAKLKVSFFRPFWGDYWIVGLDADYQWAIVSNAKGTTCWILSRTPELADELYDGIVEQCRAKGIAVGQLLKTPQDRR